MITGFHRSSGSSKASAAASGEQSLASIDTVDLLFGEYPTVLWVLVIPAA